MRNVKTCQEQNHMVESSTVVDSRRASEASSGEVEVAPVLG